MKKLILTLLLAVSLAFAADARDKYTHDVNSLPPAARTVLKNNFKSDVSVIKIDKDFGRVSEYEVILNDGCEVTFDRSGNWKEIECSNRSAVPDKMIPQTILSWIKKNQKGTRVIGIERKRGGFTVELNNGVEAKFNQAGRFLRYDD